MSSVQENITNAAIKNILIRKGSLNKIKCCAYSTLGFVFSKKFSVINVLDDAMNSSRTLIKMPVITIIMPTVHILCVAMSVLINLIRNQNFAVGMSFETLDKFITEFNQLKAARMDRQTENIEVDKVSMPSSEAEKDDIFYGPMCKKITQKKTDRLLIVASYTSIIFVYAQFLLLLYLIGISIVKLGMLFMLVCATAIGYLIIKILFLNAARKSHPSRRCSRKLKAVRMKLFGKALTLKPITCVLPQIKFNTCAGKFPMDKQKSL